MSPVRPSLQRGAVLAGRYRLEHHISAGGMGTVWCATDLQIGGEVAVKLLANESADEEERSRLVREVKAARAVQHSHVVRVFDGIESEYGPLMVMELLRGESLRDRLERQGRLSVADSLAIVVPVVSAVSAAHAKGVIHRDLKPANIFLCEPEGGGAHVKVLDFGIAKLASHGQGVDFGDLTRSGAILGTPPYMSPEQAFGEKDIDHRTDIWSLGIVLYECLSGVLPTRADGTRQVFKILAVGKIPPLREAAPDVPPALAALVDRMLAKEPRDRPRDLAEVKEALEGRGAAIVTDEAPKEAAPRAPAGEAAPTVQDTPPKEAAPSAPEAAAVPRPAASQEEAFAPTVQMPAPTIWRRFDLRVAGLVTLGLLAATVALSAAGGPQHAPVGPLPPASSPVVSAGPTQAPAPPPITSVSVAPSASSAPAPVLAPVVSGSPSAASTAGSSAASRAKPGEGPGKDKPAHRIVVVSPYGAPAGTRGAKKGGAGDVY